MGALIGLGFWLFFILQPKDSSTNPSDSNKVSNILSSIELIISDDSFKTINDSKTLEVAIDTNNSSLISSVDYLLDGKVVGRSIEAPFIVTISLAQLAAGEHKLQAIAYDLRGGSVKSKVFIFTIEPGEIVPSDDSSSDMITSLPRKKSSVVTASTSSSGNSGGNSGENGNGSGGDSGDGTRTASGWWASLPSSMQICGSSVLEGGPSSAPEGAIVVPAGSNFGFSFNQTDKTFWFAPGVHTLGPGEFNSITPGSGSTYIGAPGAVIDGMNANSYAFVGSASNVTIKYLEIRNFAVGGMDNMNEGVINHDSGTGWTMEYLNAHNNDGAAVFVGSENTVRYSCLKDNGQYGFSMFKPPIQGDSPIQDIVLDHNEISGNNQDNWEADQPGCGCTGGGKFWDVKGATITNNYVHDNLSTGLWADTNDIDFLFDSNWVEHNSGEGIWYEISYNATISRNVLKRNAWTTGQNNLGSPGPAIYISESGGDSRLQSSTSGSTNLQIKNNLLEDNFSGVSIYENSNRFCNSHGNTSTGYCTPFVSPTNFSPLPSNSSYPNPVNNTHPCYTQLTPSPSEPYITDCRWHAKNVKVFNNEFRFNEENVPCAGNYCGVQALIATGDNNIPWAPPAYNIANIQQDVMYNNNNKFYDNAYIGNWRFAKGYGETINYSNWQTGLFLQDAGSTYTSDPIENALDTNTATLEGSIGRWEGWYSVNVARSNLQAHTGSYSLETAITSSGGWAARLNNYPGFDVNPGNKQINFWVKQGAGAISNVEMKIQWVDVANTVIRTDTIPVTGLSTSWQEGALNVSPPAGVNKAFVLLMSSSGSAGNTLYLDDFKIADGP